MLFVDADKATEVKNGDGVDEVVLPRAISSVDRERYNCRFKNSSRWI